MKTITISDEVYEKLERIKGKRSFSEIINYLITSNVSLRIERLLSLSSYLTGHENEMLEVIKRVKAEFRARTYETSPRHELSNST
ncbi:MAG: antitoxin VapB family protein [Nitrososphaerota archaeon]